MDRMDGNKKVISLVVIALIIAISFSSMGTYFLMTIFDSEPINFTGTDEELSWTDEFNIEELTFSSTGNNTYFILQPGFILVLEGVEDGEVLQVIINVTDTIEMVGTVETRVVIEKESKNGEIVEISYNYFAICNETNDIFYFGEAVDDYEDGELVSHKGQWRADEDDNKAGILIPGIPIIGARYYQEIAKGVAMDRAEVISIGSTLEVPADTFENCLITEETTPLEPLVREYKYYAPGIGLIAEEYIYLVDYGFL